MKTLTQSAIVFAAIAASQPACAAPGDPVPIAAGLTLDPIIDGRLRYEHVDTPVTAADALTLRLRAGAELKSASDLSFLAEGEGNLALDDSYNAFPFAIASSQRRSTHAVIADPMTIGLNRLQLQYQGKGLTVTVGRQRINLDDQRFVGSVGWRQNEQTFDALRGEAAVGPISLDATYALRQRTVFGIDAGPRQAYDGNFVFLGAGAKLGPLQAKGFAYLLDYDPRGQFGALAVTNADTQTYGLRVTGSFRIDAATRLAIAASYARQGDWKDNPASYAEDYLAAEAALTRQALTATAGYELLGGDGTHSFQTPMASLHKFNGWADLFLTTPANGLQDWYGGLAYRFGKRAPLNALNAAVTYHRFSGDRGALHYGDEWDASIGFKLGRAAILAKVADYKAAGFGTDTRKAWVQVEFGY